MHYSHLLRVGFVIGIILMLPNGVYAETFKEFIGGLIDIMNMVIPTIILASILYYFWHIIQNVIQKDSKNAEKNMKDIVGWGLLGLFVMVSIWGILQILQNTFLSAGGGTTRNTVQTK